MRYALVDENGVVVNMVAVDGDWTPPDGLRLVVAPAEVSMNWRYANNQFTAPPPDPIPDPPTPTIPEITAYQAKITFHDQNLLDLVQTYVNGANTDFRVKTAWECVPVWKRQDAFVNAIATAIGMSQEHLDTFFVTAAQNS